MSLSRTTRLAGVLAGTAAGLAILAGPASAHVTVQPSTATAGDYATLSFEVPNESDNTSTVGLNVQLPTDAPIASVSVQPKPGWTYEIERGAPAEPVTVHGAQVTEVVTEISWKTAPGNTGIQPGEFDTFTISAGPLPETVGTLAFKALQTYSDGDVVRWINVAAPGAEEPDDPAPVLTLTAASAEGDAAPATTAGSGQTAAAGTTDGDDGTARSLGIAGLAVGVLGLVVGGFALVAARRRQTTP